MVNVRVNQAPLLVSLKRRGSCPTGTVLNRKIWIRKLVKKLITRENYERGDVFYGVAPGARI